MSKWQHSICDPCWKQHHPGQGAHRAVKPWKMTCCYCGAENSSGILVQDNPANTLCGGIHVEVQDDITPINVEGQ
jgi:hypothetical protein